MSRFFRESVVFTIGVVINNLFLIVIFPVLYRLFSPEEMGIVENVNAFGQFFILFATLQMDSGFARFYTDESFASRRNSVFTTAWLTLLSGTLTGAAIVGFLSVPICHFFFGSADHQEYLLLALLFFSLSGLFLFLQTAFRFQSRARVYVTLSACQFLFTCLVMAFSWYRLQLGFLSYFSGYITALILVLIPAHYLLRKEFNRRFDPQLLKDMLKFSLPFIPLALAFQVLRYSDRLVLTHILGLGTVALYSTAVRVATLLQLAVTGFQQAWGPHVYRTFHDPTAHEDFARIFRLFVRACLLLIAGISAAGPLIILLLASSRYLEATEVLPILLFSVAVFCLSWFGVGIAIARKTHLYLVPALGCITLAITLNLYLIPRFGILGAAIATASANMLLTILQLRISQRLYPLPLSLPLHLTELIAVTILATTLAHFPWQSPVYLLGYGTLLIVTAGAFGYECKQSGILRHFRHRRKEDNACVESPD